jgi:hypothetical protein
MKYPATVIGHSDRLRARPVRWAGTFALVVVDAVRCSAAAELGAANSDPLRSAGLCSTATAPLNR